MELQQLCKQHNFTLTQVRPIPGSNAELVQMVYTKTGTELCWVKSEERNKLFGIAFKTIPEDDTGVFHILEHSVLCGSAKYPVKEPFVEMLKSSMNTFLNAMTFPDKTVYPISSRNDQDFLNLTEVYLDAVFAPKILENPNIFRQEGWHYELQEDNLTYNGVVFNEMKGAMSSVDQASYRGLMKVLYPDLCYSYNSGGDPAAIPNLTYEQFMDSYRKNYHPTNARVFLDGDIPVEKTLILLDAYLSQYEMGKKQTLVPQKPVEQEQTIYYEAVNDGTPKAQLLLGKILGTFEEKLQLLARQVLCDVLAGSNDAPLKRAILETGLCQDVTLAVEDGMIQPFMMLRLHNIQDEDSAKLASAVRECAKKLVAEGIEKARLVASINRFIFNLQQMKEPQGLIRGLNCMNSWLYDGDPMQYLHFEDCFAELRSMAENGGFEPLLKEMLVDEAGLCKLHVLPSETYGADLRQAETTRLARTKEALSSAQLDTIAQEFAALSQWQQTPDSPEQLATLPKLDLSEISSEPVLCETSEEICDGVTVLRHKAASNGIVHVSAYFRLADRTLEELTKLSLLSKLLGTLPTKAKDATTLQNEIKTWLGELKFSVEVNPKLGQKDLCTPLLAVHCSVLKENIAKAEELIHEILTSTDFAHADRILEIVKQQETEQQQIGMMNGHLLAFLSAQSHFSAGGAAQAAIRGISYIQWLHTLSKNFEAELPSFTALAENTLANAVCKQRMVLSFTEDGHSDAFSFLEKFPEGTKIADTCSYTTDLPKKLGIRIPAQVSYASLATSLEIPYEGSARLLSNVLSLAYLWNEVRVKGGAYGAGMRISRGGGLFTYSYRDPNPANSLNVYRSMADCVRTLVDAGQDITGFIISTVAETEPLEDAARIGQTADADWFFGWGREQALAERKQLLSATIQELTKWCDALESLKSDAGLCIVGYADALAACEAEGLTIWDI